MRKIIRNMVFETNSSSSHSISICTNHIKNLVLPKEINFQIHSFTWSPDDEDNMSTLQGKANYLYSVSIYKEMKDEFVNRVEETLKPLGINLNFEKENKDLDRSDLIDHQAFEVVSDLIDVLMKDTNLLMNYLFSETTEIEITGDCSSFGVQGGENRIVFGEEYQGERELWNQYFGGNK